MSGQQALRERAQLLDELRQIVQAMKNLAFAQMQRLAHMQPHQARARDAVLDALASLPQEPAEAQGARSGPTGGAAGARAPVCWLVIGAGRGFCGAFNERMAAQVRALAHEQAQLRLLVAGDRLHGLLEPLGLDATALTGCATIEESDAALDEWMAAVGAELPHCREVWLLHAGESAPVRVRLAPEPEPARATPGAASAGPIVVARRYLPLPAVRSALLRQAVRLLIQGGLCESLKQENRWRLAQMQRAQDHLDELGRLMRRRYAALRQADITNEQETLMSSLQFSDV